MDWVLEDAQCISRSQWRIRFRITAAGGSGEYVYYRDIDQLFGPTSEQAYVYELTYGAGAAAVGTFFVESGQERVEKKFWVKSPDCSSY
jgi:hypothetical protein